MPKAKTPTFITELELVADSSVRRELKARFNAGFRLANAIQSEMLVRMDLVRNSPEWAAAKKIPAKIQGKSNKKRSEAFQAVKEAHRFTKSDAEKYAALVAKRSVWSGIHLNLENVSVKGWQKRYGKAISRKSPGFFQSELVRKAESAGGTVLKYSTQKTACSQTHLNGEREKKSLSQRVHYDKTGAVMHRDLFSAFLGLHVNQDSLLMVDQARNAYPSIEPILTAAWQVYGKQTSQPLQVVARSPESPTESVCVEGQKSSQIKLRDLKARPTVIALQLSLDLA